ncbi:MAG TPA: protein phosphatase 2C domain-containing protein [Candidatus Anoxymicrobiaceae bacterium]
MAELEQAQAQSEFRYGVVSKQGGRPYNEDYCTVHDYSLRRNCKYLCFMAMADGMGGHQAGDVASSVAVQMLEQYAGPTAFSSNQDFEQGAEQMLWNAFSATNSHIHDLGEANPEHEGMGTTLTCALIGFEYAHLAHVGDTRAYTISAAGIQQVTEDHSVVGKMVTEGLLTEYEARTHARRNILTRAVGPELNVEIDLLKVPMQPGDIMFMCCDGLYSAVTAGEIYQALAGGGDLHSACDRLVDLAITNGSDDNVSAIAWRMPPGEELSAAGGRRVARHEPAATGTGSLPRWASALLMLLVLCIGFAIGWGVGAVFFSNKTPAKTTRTTAPLSTSPRRSNSSSASSPTSTGPAEGNELAKGTAVVTTGSNVNLRETTDSTVQQIVAVLPNGCKLKVISGSSSFASGKSWYKVEVTDTASPANGKKGYVAADYIKVP